MSILKEEIKNGVVYLTLNRPEKSNAISREMLEALIKTFQKIKKETRVVVISGEGNTTFCAGADLKERLGMSLPEVHKLLADFRIMMDTLAGLPVPTIAIMNGDAYGGGLELALACDIRIGMAGAKYALTETKLGIIPGAGGTQRLSRIIGITKAKEYIFTAKKIIGEEAEIVGLVNYTFNKEEIFDKANLIINELLEAAPLAITAAKKAIDRGFDLNLEEGLDIERACYEEVLHTKDRNEALAAFQEKRKPIFKGE